MSKYVFSLVFAATTLALSGCAARPGFRMGWEFYVPPTLHTASTLTPLPTAMSTTYAVEGPNDVAVMQRQIQVAPAPVAGPRRLMPAPQQLPMPKQTVPGCGSSGTACEPGTTQE